MASKTFRQTALDRLSSPEQLDQLVQITSHQGWVALGTLVLVVLAALAWGYFGSVTREVTGTGFLRARTAATTSTSTSRDPELEAVLFMPPESGDRVTAGMEAHIFWEGHPGLGQQGFLRGFVSGVATKFSDQGTPTQVEVVIRPDQDASAPGWPPLSPFGKSNAVPISAKIVIQRDRPINLLMPGRRG